MMSAYLSAGIGVMAGSRVRSVGAADAPLPLGTLNICCAQDPLLSLGCDTPGATWITVASAGGMLRCRPAAVKNEIGQYQDQEAGARDHRNRNETQIAG